VLPILLVVVLAMSLLPITAIAHYEVEEEFDEVCVQKVHDCTQHDRSGRFSYKTDELTVQSTPPKVGRFLVSAPDYDDIGQVLRTMNLQHTQLDWGSYHAINDLAYISQFDAVLVNCSEYPMDIGVARAYVEAGGLLYASDLTMYWLANAFHERSFSFVSLDPQNRTGYIVDPGMRMAVGQNQIPVNFDSPGWVALTSNPGPNSRVFIQGTVSGYGISGVTVPFMFRFLHGNNGGAVYYSSFHVSVQNNEYMKSVLLDFIRAIDGNQQEAPLNQMTTVNGFIKPDPLPATLVGGGTQSYTLPGIKQNEKFAVFNASIVKTDLSMTLKDPSGTTYSNVNAAGNFIAPGSTISAISALSSDSSTASTMVVKSLGADGLIVENANPGNTWELTIKSLTSSQSSFMVGFATNQNAIEFIGSLYEDIMGREFDLEGLNFWVSTLVNGSRTGTTMVDYFFFCPEYLAKNKTDSQFVDDLYRLVMGRVADPGGRAYWLNELASGFSRNDILHRFLGEPEFTVKCQNFGVPVR